MPQAGEASASERSLKGLGGTGFRVVTGIAWSLRAQVERYFCCAFKAASAFFAASTIGSFSAPIAGE